MPGRRKIKFADNYIALVGNLNIIRDIDVECGENKERTDEYRTARRLLLVEVSEGRVLDRPRFGRIYGVNVALGSRDMTG